MVLGAQFLHRFTQPELVAITESADPLVRGYVQALSLNMARELDLTDPIFTLGMNYLVAVGLITSDRANKIMTGTIEVGI